MKSTLINSLAVCLWVGAMASSSNALAVGNGNNFGVNEIDVQGSNAHPFQANSIDLTYHACSNAIPSSTGNPMPDHLNERGYFWISSYQDADSVVDSQINYYLANGYHIYGVYQFTSDRVGGGPTPLGQRRGYEMTGATLTLYLDPLQNTNIGLPGCQFAYNNNNDDVRIGGATNLLAGEKSEKNGLANGDFEMVFDDWTWDNPAPFVPFTPLSSVSFNANVTSLGGPLDNNHRPEGSGNIFWRD